MATTSSSTRSSANRRRRGPGAPGGDRPRVAPPRATLTPVAPAFLRDAGRARARFVACAPGLVVLAGAAVAVAASPAVGVVLALLGVVVGVVNVRVGSTRRLVAALRRLRATDVDTVRIENLLEGLCVAAGLSVPELVVLDDDAPNAVVLGHPAERAVLFCTSGLLDGLDRIELEGLLAHELAHLKRGDAADAVWACVAAGALGLVTDSAARFVRWLVRPSRETFADLGGVAFTRYPPGLLNALQRLRDAPSNRPERLSPSVARLTEPLWCAPLSKRLPRHVVAGELDLDERIGQLAEL